MKLKSLNIKNFIIVIIFIICLFYLTDSYLFASMQESYKYECGANLNCAKNCSKQFYIINFLTDEEYIKLVRSRPWGEWTPIRLHIVDKPFGPHVIGTWEQTDNACIFYIMEKYKYIFKIFPPEQLHLAKTFVRVVDDNRIIIPATAWFK